MAQAARRRRDFIPGENARGAAVLLEECKAALNSFSTQVYKRQAGVPSQEKD